MKYGWLVATEPRTSAQGKTYDRISILDAETRITSAYNWFRGMGKLVPTCAVEYVWTMSKDNKFQNLTTLQLLEPQQQGYPGPMPPSWARVANSPQGPQPDAPHAVDPADLDDPTEREIERHSINHEAKVSEARRLALGCATALIGNTSDKTTARETEVTETLAAAKRFEAWLQGGA